MTSPWRTPIRATVAILLVAPLALAGGPGWEPIGELAAADSASRDQFGFAIDIDGDQAVVGARYAAGDDGSRGAAYVFERDLAGQWNQVAKLAPDDGEASGFAESVAIEDGRIAVGARYDIFDGHRGGSVYVFEEGELGWGLQAKIHNPNSDGGSWADSFGWAVDLNEGRIAVGAYDADPGGVRDAGAAYVFEWRSEAWWGDYVPSPSLEPYQEFGISLALDAGTLLVGGQDSYQVEPDGGEAFVLTHDLGGWQLQATLDDPNLAGFDAFGWSVALDGDTAVVGDYYEDIVQDLRFREGAGAAYVYERDGTTWQRTATLTAPQSAAWAFFGESIALDGDRIAVGAPYDPVSNTAGAVYLFDRDDGNWAFDVQLRDPQPRRYASFGEAVAMDGDTLLAGAIGDWFRGHAGKAQGFRFACEDGLAALHDTPANGAISGTIHDQIEPRAGLVDPRLEGGAHEVNCQTVVEAEEIVG